MSKIVFAWELGSGYGHLSGFTPIADLLKQRGHEIIYVIKDLANAEIFLQGQYDYFQAPVFFSNPTQQKPVYSYADLLRNVGFETEKQLLCRVKAWKNLIAMLGPDVVVSDHSPTALTALHHNNLPKILFGSGFFVPPTMTPLPNIRSWIKVPQRHLEDTENHVKKVINGVYQTIGAPPLEKVSELFEVNENILCTFKELEHYPQRGQVKYWGPRFSAGEGEDLKWPSSHDKKIFAYLHPAFQHLNKLLEAVSGLEASIVIHCPGIGVNVIRQYSRANITFSDKPVDQSQVAEQSDLVICHAGHGTVSAVLLAGCPIFLLPMHLEQMLVAKAVADVVEAGLFVLPEIKNPNFKKSIKTLLTDNKYKQSAQAFAKTHAGFNLDRRNAEIADLVESFL